jgi:hypothetical protein
MHCDIDAPSILRFHERQLRARDWPVMAQVPAGPAAWEWIAANHRYNGLLWHEEARARRLDLPPAEIAAGRRLAERYRQKGREAAAAIDAALPAAGARRPRQGGAHHSGESAGTMIDRLSSLALEIHHVRAHAQRLDAGAEHLRACAGKLDALLARRRGLAADLAAMLDAGEIQAHQ